MGENIEVKDVQKTEYLDKNGLDMLWAKVKENTRNQVEVERNRAVAKENSIIDTKADKSALDNYVLSTTLTALEQKVTANTTAISAKQDAGNYIPYENYENGKYTYKLTKPHKIQFGRMYLGDYYLNTVGGDGILFEKYGYGHKDDEEAVKYSFNGITSNKYDDCLATSDASFKPISDFVLKTELPAVPTKTSELTNDSNFITADDVDDAGYYLNDALNLGLKNNGVLTIQSTGITSDVGDGFSLDGTGISFYARGISDIPTAQGGFIDISDYALNSQVTALEQTVTDNTTAIEGKQDKGNYIPYITSYGAYGITSPISVVVEDRESVTITTNRISISGSGDPHSISIERDGLSFACYDPQMPNMSASTEYTINGITSNKYNNCLATSDGTFKPISDFVLSSAYNEKIAALEARIAALEAKHTEAAA